MRPIVRIGNAQGFWGDSLQAPAQLIAQQPDLDYITLDYLAEVSMSILAIQREKNPHLGYAADFIDAIQSLAPFWKKGAQFKIIANAGGLNPYGCGQAALEILKKEGLSKLKIGIVSGDDVLDHLKSGENFANLDTGEALATVSESLVTANAYLGAKPIVEALEKGADIVITGRIADPSLTVAPCVHHFKWSWNDYDKLAGATIAGHLIECGTQVTGGISTNWLELPDLTHIGYPLVEVDEKGHCVVTKPQNTGGSVNEQTIKEQLLYEIGDPANYLSPDVIVSFLHLQLEQDGPDRIKVTGAKGKPPPPDYKVSATYKAGYTAEGMLTIFGNKVHQKAHICGEIILQRVKSMGFDLEESHVECIGSGDVLPGVMAESPIWDLKEGVLRIAVADQRKEAVECFTKQIAPLVTSGPQGITGYATGRPKVRRVFGFWPCLIPAHLIKPKVDILEVGIHD